MPIQTLNVEAKIIGRSGQIERWQVGLPTNQPLDTLQDLLAVVVRAEVAAFQTRQAERQLTTPLTSAQLEAALKRGRIISGGQDLSQPVDSEEAAATAFQAFEDGLFLVFIDERQYTRLDEPVALTEHSVLTFIRLIALAGG